MFSAATTSARRGSRNTTRHLCLLVLIATLGAPAAAQATAGPAVSWGGNSHGELGKIYRDDFEASPVTVEGQNNIATVAAGDGANLAILGDGTVSAWGGNVAGQLGDGTREATWEKGTSHVIVKEPVA